MCKLQPSKEISYLYLAVCPSVAVTCSACMLIDSKNNSGLQIMLNCAEVLETSVFLFACVLSGT